MPSIDRQVLVLNRLWQPVNICGAKRAVGLLFLGHAEVVHAEEIPDFYTHDVDSWLSISREYDGSDVIHTVAFSFRLPAIIVLRAYDRLPRQEVKFSRQTIFERDKFTCQYCAVRFEPRDLNLDHVIPREKGGKTTWENVVCSCIRCNTVKANKLPGDANMWPMQEPRKPRWRPFFGPGTPKRIEHSSWRHFIGSPPGVVELSC
jgi:5-methylcytosine-specific restriction endonuclease McrA